MGKNKNCPSYDYGECNTFPAPYAVQCGGEETKNCKWLNFDFIGAKYEAKEEKGAKMGNKNVVLDSESFCGICLLCIMLGQGYAKDDPTMLLHSLIGLLIKKGEECK